MNFGVVGIRLLLCAVVAFRTVCGDGVKSSTVQSAVPCLKWQFQGLL